MMGITTNLDVATSFAGSLVRALPCPKLGASGEAQALRARGSRKDHLPIHGRGGPREDPSEYSALHGEAPTLALWIACVEQGVGEHSEDSWSLLVQRLQPYLRTVLRHRLGAMGITERDEIDEALQDVYCRLFERECAAMKRSRATSDGEVLAYLKRICSTVVLDRNRSRRAQKRSAILTDLVDDVASSSPTGYDRLRTRELRNQLHEECHLVSTAASGPRDVWIFERAVLDGWPTDQIADWVGLRPPSVDAIVCRMRQKLAVRGLAVPARNGHCSSTSAPSAVSKVQRRRVAASEPSSSEKGRCGTIIGRLQNRSG